MGVVSLALDTQLHRNVALKYPKLSKQIDPQERERFFREARSAATLRHPNICPVFDAGEIDGVCYIAMAYIEGEPLSAYIRSDSLSSVRNAVLVIRKIAHAVHDAHQHGIIHRDLKPANIIIDDRNEPIVMDFGLARFFAHPVEESLQQASHEGSNLELTAQGVVVGTPQYMSPEQALADAQGIGPPTDIFSLGVIFYELLTGQRPFKGNTLAELIRSLTSQEPAPPSTLREDIPPEIDQICLRMLAKKPEDRYANMLACTMPSQTLRVDYLVLRQRVMERWSRGPC